MKRLDRYVNEVLVHGNFGKNLHCAAYSPKTKEELQNIIIERIKKEGPECDLNDIDVSEITDMGDLFNCIPRKNGVGNPIFKDFNGDISQWNVSNVTNMWQMFSHCAKFNCDISEWDVSNVINMGAMFNKCEMFNQDISRWNIHNVIDMRCMLWECKAFNKDLSNWQTKAKHNLMLDYSGIFHIPEFYPKFIK